MSPKQLTLTVLLSVVAISGPTCTPELVSTGGGGAPQCIQRTERSAKGLYSSISQLPQVARLTLMFANQADRDQTIEQDLRFVETKGSYAIYEITGPNPRLYMPGIIDMYQPTSQMCPGDLFGEFESYASFNGDQRVNGVWQGETQPRLITDAPIQTVPWHGENPCGGAWDVLGGHPVPDGRVQYTFFDFDPPPPVGSLWTFRMVNIGPHAVPGPNVHGDGEPGLCCTEQDGCCLLGERDCPPETYPYCGDRNVDPGEECDDGHNVNGDGCDANCQLEPYCGDGTRDSGEQCDDGNNANGDGCSAICRFEPRCGDGHIDAGEICDDGANNGKQGYCKTDCTGPVEPPGPSAYCGDGTRDAGEQCDDGNNANGDGCSATCTIEPRCGDGHVDAGETCDDGVNNGKQGYCKSDCTGPVEPPGPGGDCGDGIINGDEECDDGDDNGRAGYCTEDCTFPVEPPGPTDGGGSDGGLPFCDELVVS